MQIGFPCNQYHYQYLQNPCTNRSKQLLCFVLMALPRSPRTRELVLPQDSIMGNKLSKCATLSFHERMQWWRSLGFDFASEGDRLVTTLGQLKFNRDPGPMPYSFAEALDICMPPSPKFTATQMRGLKEVFLAYVLKHSDKAFWTHLREVAVRMKGGNSVELIEDRYCGLALWITFEEKRNSQLISLIHSAAASFFHGVNPECVSIVSQQLLDVSASKTCAYKSCPSGCMLRHSYTCSGCGVVTYCSTYCQKAAWATHRDICRLHQNYVRNARFDIAA